jgi:glycerol-3-phosphate dehydrogenase (NAD(P)+)
MNSKNTSNKPVGVIGAGSFGTAMANMLAQKREVIFYARDPEVVQRMKSTREHKGKTLHENILPTNSLEEVANACDVIFPIVPSSGFRSMMRNLSPFLMPFHILIHGTKGLDIQLPAGRTIETARHLSRNEVKTMSEVIREESVVIRVGCLAGPNLAREIIDGQPAATVVASHFTEVIAEGQKLLRNDRFQVYGNPELIGIELAGVLKNIIAIASGILSGLGLGENAKGLLISRGMVEMIYLGKALGGNTRAFIGLAGIGDLVATCNSTFSRNFTVGNRLAKGETLEQILASMEEVAEGVNTVRTMKKMADYYKVKAPITEMLNKVLFHGLDPKDALAYLMKYPYNVDIDFI